MKYTTIVIIVAIALVGFLVLRGNGAGSENASPAVTTGETSGTFADTSLAYDFGKVSMATGNVEHTFRLENTTGSNVLVTRAETSCMCTKAFVKAADRAELGPFGMVGHGLVPSFKETLAAGESLIVRVVFDPNAHGPAGIGKIERVVTVTTDKGQIKLNFKADVTP